MRDQHVRRVGARAIYAEVTRPGNAIVVLVGLADIALAAADPRVHESLLPDLHPLCFGAELLHDAERFVSKREGRNAASILHVEALAAAEIEVAVPNMQVAVADAGARDANEGLGALRRRSVENHPLQGFAVLDHLIADHALPASF